MAYKTFQYNYEFRFQLPIFSKQSESIDKLLTLFHDFEATLLTTLKKRRNISFPVKAWNPICAALMLSWKSIELSHTPFLFFSISIIN